MAAAVGRIGGGVGGYGSGSGSGSLERLRNSGKKRRNEKDGFRVSCVSSPSVADPYKTLRIHHGATESEVKKAFRQLALKVSVLVAHTFHFPLFIIHKNGNFLPTLAHKIYFCCCLFYSS